MSAPRSTETDLDPGPSRFRLAVAVLGVLSLGVAAVDLSQREFVINRADGDVRSVSRASRRLAWIGRDNPAVYTHVARVLARRNQALAPGDARIRDLLQRTVEAEARAS